MAKFIAEFDNREFFVNQYYFHDNVRYVYFITVQLIGSITEAERYTYSIILKGSDEELSFSGKCFSLQKEFKSIYESKECLIFDATTAPKFHHPYKRGVGNMFKFDIKLSRKEEPTRKRMIYDLLAKLQNSQTLEC